MTKLKCRVMDVEHNGAGWGDEMVVTVDLDEEAEAEAEDVAKAVNRAQYEEITGEPCEDDEDQDLGKVVQAAGTLSHGICWVQTGGQGSGDVIIEWHEASR